MIFLPIVQRELRVAARRRSTHWLRLSAALLALAVGGWILLVFSFRPPQELGLPLFVALAVLAFAYCGLAGVRATADCLSEEKRGGTLGLLFLTDLRGYDIILGKLAATSVNVFYGLLAIFPVMAIPLLIGGVSAAEFGRVLLALLNILFFSLAVGMVLSSVSRDDRKAMFGCLLVVLLFAGGLPLLGVWIGDWSGTRRIHPAFLLPSPGYAAFMAFDEPFQRSLYNYFYPSIACLHCLAWVWLVVAALVVPRTWQEKPDSPAGSRWRLWKRWAAQGGSDARLALRRRLLELNPVYWLAARDRLKPALVWFALLLGGGIWVIGLVSDPDDWWDADVFIWTGLLSHSILKVWLASEACRRFALDRQSGALEWLLCTPLRIPEILRGQLRALVRQFLGPALVVLLVDLLFLLHDSQAWQWAWLWTVGMIMFAADLIALAWVGMWMGLSSRNPNRATAAAVSRILVLPWVLFAAGITALSLASRWRFRNWIGSNFEAFPFLFWLVIGLGVNLVFGGWAWWKLHQDFRVFATRRYQPRFVRRPRSERVGQDRV